MQPKPSKLVVLFVHGIAGDATSWGLFQSLLAGDPDVSNRIEIDFYNYPTGMLRFFNRWRSLRVEDLARGLRTHLEFKFPDRPVLLVCHSMGGLVAKRYICDSIDASRVAGVITFATPHDGAEIAKVAASLSREHRQARQIRPDDIFVEQLNRDWEKLRCEARLDVTYVAAGQDKVVSRNSADNPSRPTELIPDHGHINVVKPNNNTDLSFLIVKRVIERLSRDEGDFLEAQNALENGDGHTLASILANRARNLVALLAPIARLKIAIASASKSRSKFRTALFQSSTIDNRRL